MKSRFYCHRSGFSDNCAAVEVRPDETVWLIYKNGSREKYLGATLQRIQEMVDAGLWVEVDNPFPRAIAQVCEEPHHEPHQYDEKAHRLHHWKERLICLSFCGGVHLIYEIGTHVYGHFH